MDKTKILIVEDNPIVAEDLKIKLIDLGYGITATAYSGEQALESVRTQRPDIALMDIRLGRGMNGIETALKLKDKYNISVIYLTAHADDNTVSKAKLTEPYGYVVKPFNDTELKSVIEIAVYKQQSDRKLRESQQWFQTTLNSIGDGVIATDMTGNITFMNPIAETLTGWSQSEAKGKPLNKVFNIINEFTRKSCENPVLKVIKTGQIIGLANHTILISRDGSERPIKDSGAPIILDDGTRLGVVLIFQDDSMSREAEERLRDSEERFKRLFEHAPLPYQSLDKNGCIIEVNHTWLEMLGYQKQDVVGKSFGDFLNHEWVDHFKENFPKFKSVGEILGVEFEMKKKDGTFIIARFDGKIRQDQAGEFIQTHCVFKDVSDEKRMLKKLEKQEIALRQTQKLEAIGNLAGGIAHDFNNILTSILGFTDLSLQDVQKDSEIYDNLTEVIAAGKRAKNLVKQILTFSRKGEQEKQPLDIHSVISENLKMLRSTIPSNIEIRTQISHESITINANRSQMNQVIMNLVTNAVHAIEDNGMIDIGLQLMVLDKSDMDQYPDMIPGTYAKIFVSDTGCGIDQENLNAVFDPYFTTKSPDKGTGLGLAVVHGIVKLHSGHISVYSEREKGSTFNVYLPLATQVEKRSVIQKETKVAEGGERILFVDDEPTIVKLQKRTLERLGYEVTTKTSSVEALETFRLTPDLFQLVITDMTMPEMTGDKLSQAVKDIKPDIPVILCTGFSEKINETTAFDFPIDGFLMKPIDTDKMAKAVRKVLDKSDY